MRPRQIILASRAGITLIEVVASLALMATLLVALLQAKAGATQRSADARQKLVAVNMADQMLAMWWADPKGVPVPAHGALPGESLPGGSLPNDLQWQTRFVPNLAAHSLRARMVRLVLFSPARPDRPFVSVEVLQNVPSQPASAK